MLTWTAEILLVLTIGERERNWFGVDIIRLRWRNEERGETEVVAICGRGFLNVFCFWVIPKIYASREISTVYDRAAVLNNEFPLWSQKTL